MLTGLYSYGQAARLTHAYAATLSSTVDPIRSAPLATEHHPGQQQRHRQHRRRPMPIWVLKTYRKLEQNCRLLGSYYQVQYWKVEITGYFNTTYQLEIRDAVGTTVGKSFAGSVVSIC